MWYSETIGSSLEGSSMDTTYLLLSLALLPLSTLCMEKTLSLEKAKKKLVITNDTACSVLVKF